MTKPPAFIVLVLLVVVMLCNLPFVIQFSESQGELHHAEVSVVNRVDHRCPLKDQRNVRVVVQYAYSEGSRGDAAANLGFFLRHGVTNPPDDRLDVHYAFTINGECTSPSCHEVIHRAQHSAECPSCIPRVSILHRPNLGFDFGGHAAMLDVLDATNSTYDAYIFLNCGVTGPFLSTFMPSEWHWVRAFTDKLCNRVGVVGTSIVCLPASDEGGMGPKVEGFAFALSSGALQVVRERGTSFQQHPDKVAAILSGEYNLTTVLLNEGYDIDCLLKAYQGIDWRNETNWQCNYQAHPSRANSYYGISMHPLEVIFHKSHWAGTSELVLGDYTSQYMKWQDEAVSRLNKSE